ncbi:MarR family winged helix-turn-helix transcriptional regulator [Nocardioides sp. SYSU D00038]|uniref:MarR family winged helix-turn-helix transcriptional regulator n=1 Tax=Nocardioides sp. SYSU D00038 TaxID=2812554 RepID=UPI0019683E4A|nr:MarR family transcriptional regulator [Nocardioides sp. SYSU D00038]
MVDQVGSLGQQMWDFVYAYDAAYDRAAREVGLSAAQACLLKAVAERPVTMGELASRLLCDASNVTQIVTRLESKGLVRRQPGARDGRSKEVVITPDGAVLDERMRVAFTFPVERLGLLSSDARDALGSALDVMLGRDG